MYKLGLKLWSINTDYYLKEAERLYNEGYFDYIELYVVPDSLETINQWKKLNIPFRLHAPHFDSGVNLALKEKEEYNFNIYKQVREFYNQLNASYVIVHGGIEGTIEEIVRQLKKINLGKMLIENKPYVGPTDPKLICRGNSIEEISYIMNNLNCGFCLDIGHAFCSANVFKINPYEYLASFNKLNPVCYHLSDNYENNVIDKHFHLGSCEYDFNRIFKIINNTTDISIETLKDSKENLDDFKNDIVFLRGIINAK